jgi:RNA recognition motif. (a.k.a. RRM, RBD, or RNP domain)
MQEFAYSTQNSFSRKSSMQRDTECSSENDSSCLFPINTFVGGIPRRCSQDHLTQFMSQFGYVKEVYISKDENNGGHKGFAFVNFSSVTRIDLLFGNHLWFGKKIEIKRSLQEYINLMGVPHQATESDIVSAFSSLGHRACEILMGGKVPGVSRGCVGVRLMKFSFQEQVVKQGFLTVLGKRVKMMLHIPGAKRPVLSMTEKSQLSRARKQLKISRHPYIKPVENQVSVRHGSMHLNSEEVSVAESDRQNALHNSESKSAERMPVLSLSGDVGEDWSGGMDSPSNTDTASNKKNRMIADSTYQKQISLVRRLSLDQHPAAIYPTEEEFLLHPASDVVFKFQNTGPHSLMGNIMQLFSPEIIQRREILITFYAFPGHL